MDWKRGGMKKKRKKSELVSFRNDEVDENVEA